MELVMMTNDLMPEGKPQYLEMIRYPTIASLIQTEGRKKMLAVLVLLVKDFCGSVNVVRNMTEEQMIETASMLLSECGNFRMEDYVTMFTMAKRGAFHPEVKIYDRLDIQVIAAIVDEYWVRRKRAGEIAQEEEIVKYEQMGMMDKSAELLHPQDHRMIEGVDKLGAALDGLRQVFQQNSTDNETAADHT